MTDTTKTYEMLWDCEYCGHRKLLGKTHRHCPECGAAQNPDKRYFPPDSEKVAVEDHEYAGADRHCPACRAPNSAKAAFCGECGSPMDRAGEVKRVDGSVDAATAPKKPAQEKPAQKKKGCLIAGIVGAVLLIGAVLIGVFATSEAPLTVAAHRWSREIQVEEYKDVQESAWCDHLPSGAREVSRSREVRSHRKISDGEDCRTVRSDNGDGTFSETQKCTTKYRSEPVYDDKCRFRIMKWVVSRSVKSAGESLSPEPAWPDLTLSKKGMELGSERPGKRIEAYTVRFVDDKKQNHECELPQDKWRSLKPGDERVGEVNRVTDRLDCDSLRRPGDTE